MRMAVRWSRWPKSRAGTTAKMTTKAKASQVSWARLSGARRRRKMRERKALRISAKVTISLAGVDAGRWRCSPSKDGDSGEPDDEWRVGVEVGGAVGDGAVEQALAHEQEPELVVAGCGEEGEEGGHAEGGEKEDAKGVEGGSVDRSSSGCTEVHQIRAQRCSLRARVDGRVRQMSASGCCLRLTVGESSKVGTGPLCDIWVGRDDGFGELAGFAGWWLRRCCVWLRAGGCGRRRIR